MKLSKDSVWVERKFSSLVTTLTSEMDGLLLVMNLVNLVFQNLNINPGLMTQLKNLKALKDGEKWEQLL